MEIYLQDRYNVLPFLAVVFGLRADYLSGIDELSIQPRGSLLLGISDGSQLQFAYGNYNQVPGPPRLTRSVGNPDLSTSQANHYVLEFTRQVSPATEFKVAGYYKNLVDLATVDADARYLNQALGMRKGLRYSSGIGLEIDFWDGAPTPMDFQNGVTALMNRIVTIRLTKRTLLPLRRRTAPRPRGRLGQNGNIEPETLTRQFLMRILERIRATENLSISRSTQR